MNKLICVWCDSRSDSVTFPYQWAHPSLGLAVRPIDFLTKG